MSLWAIFRTLTIDTTHLLPYPSRMHGFYRSSRLVGLLVLTAACTPDYEYQRQALPPPERTWVPPTDDKFVPISEPESDSKARKSQSEEEIDEWLKKIQDTPQKDDESESKQAQARADYQMALQTLEEHGVSFVQEYDRVEFRVIPMESALKLGISESSRHEAIRAFIPLAKAVNETVRAELAQEHMDLIDLPELIRAYNERAQWMVNAGVGLTNFERFIDIEDNGQKGRFPNREFWSVSFLDHVESLGVSASTDAMDAMSKFVAMAKEFRPVATRLLESSVTTTEGTGFQKKLYRFAETELGKEIKTKALPHIERVLALESRVAGGLSLRDAALEDALAIFEEDQKSLFAATEEYGVRLVQPKDQGDWTYDRQHYLETYNKSRNHGGYRTSFVWAIENYGDFAKSLEDVEGAGMFGDQKDAKGVALKWRDLLRQARRTNAVLQEVKELVQ